jgi:hypothetical protein
MGLVKSKERDRKDLDGGQQVAACRHGAEQAAHVDHVHPHPRPCPRPGAHSARSTRRTVGGRARWRNVVAYFWGRQRVHHHAPGPGPVPPAAAAVEPPMRGRGQRGAGEGGRGVERGVGEQCGVKVRHGQPAVVHVERVGGPGKTVVQRLRRKEGRCVGGDEETKRYEGETLQRGGSSSPYREAVLFSSVFALPGRDERR